MDTKQEIAMLENQIASLKQGQPMSSAPAPSGNILSPNVARIYGLLAEHADDPSRIGAAYANTVAQAEGILGDTKKPSSVSEWEYYDKLSPQDKKRYLEMKRGVSLTDLAGGKAAIYSGGMGGPQFYSSPGQEFAANRAMQAAGKEGQLMATRHDVLSSGKQQRFENYSQALRLREKVAQKELPTGQYTGLIYKVLPQADQESLDALAEMAARARLKANGETRPTDADVLGMKRALFGSGRTDEFTVESLDRLLREIEAQEQEQQVLDASIGSPRPTTGALPTSPGRTMSNTLKSPTKKRSEDELKAKYGIR